MKKLILILCCLLMLVSCGAPEKTVEMSVVTNTVKNTATFRDMTYEPETQVVLDFYALSNEVSECYLIISATGATAEEIAVFKLSDKSNAASVLEKCETRKQDRIDLYKDYRPDEMGILEETEIFSKGDYVFYICADNKTEIKTQLESLFK